MLGDASAHRHVHAYSAHACSALRRGLALGAGLAALLAAGCETPGGPPPPGPPPITLPKPQASCSLIGNAAFARFQVEREAVLAEMKAPRQAGLIVQVRKGKQAEFAALPMWSGGKDYSLQEISGGLYVVRGQDIANVEAASAAMADQAALVEHIEPNFYLYSSQAAREPDDPCYAVQWHYWSRSGARAAPGGASLPQRWAQTTGSADVVVAVLDTGFAANADNAPDNLAAGWDFVSNLFDSGDGDGRDPDPADPGDSFASFHGTHVAGTIGSALTNNGVEVASVSWRVRIQPVRVLGLNGGSTSDIIDAIRWAAGLAVPGVPNNGTPARVINMSLGGPGGCSRAMQAAIDDAVDAGALVVVAAGNDRADASRFTPAGCTNVVTVAAGDFDGRLAPYSNFGAAVEIMAPGGDVSADRNRDGVPDGVISTVRNGLANYNGTSMAAPHVAGVAALLLAENPALTPTQVTEALLATAIPRSPSDCIRPCGAGLLNAAPAGAAGGAPGAGK